ncbi:phosphatidylglycerol lysyltransferase domain-containing protein [Clostridium estertheticum]|uniref:DUF2156 domain-containing protein n=1 Tax=Clostridium estertheticum TaxID=238834 RepID=A0A7Y3SY17_9CLOT|nr:phosphatidylglycerol lysyltransferase domain-containing protein [Clostridium estertheticum]NNU76717.1 DUF2156 domain-containing protein [Clostridium estertheticum]WLC77432.1 DUF2156 domain-containing protein [Clostridium estertheticum]
MRNAINHSSDLGITVSEYKPLEKRDKLIEQQINDVSDEWLKDKSSSELSFMLGALVNATKEAGKVGCMLMRLLTNITILIKNNVILLFISSIFVNCTINTIWRYTHYCKQLRKYLF